MGADPGPRTAALRVDAARARGQVQPRRRLAAGKSPSVLVGPGGAGDGRQDGQAGAVGGPDRHPSDAGPLDRSAEQPFHLRRRARGGANPRVQPGRDPGRRALATDRPGAAGDQRALSRRVGKAQPRSKRLGASRPARHDGGSRRAGQGGLEASAGRDGLRLDHRRRERVSEAGRSAQLRGRREQGRRSSARPPGCRPGRAPAIWRHPRRWSRRRG